jgi:hypothetical protein
MPLHYRCGEEVLKGDHITLHGEPGEVEVVADALAKDPLALWHLRQDGPGVLIREPKVFGRVFFAPEDCDWQSLSFVSRQLESSK